LRETRKAIIKFAPINEDGDIIIDKLKELITSKTKIIAVTDIPRTKNGKIVELAVKNVIEGKDIKNKEALENPHILEQYKNLKELKT